MGCENTRLIIHGGFWLACGRNRFHTGGVNHRHDHGTASRRDAKLAGNGQIAIGHEIGRAMLDCISDLRHLIP